MPLSKQASIGWKDRETPQILLLKAVVVPSFHMTEALSCEYHPLMTPIRSLVCFERDMFASQAKFELA